MTDFEDRIEEIAEEIKETSVEASRAEDSEDTLEAGKKYKQVGILADQGLKLLEEHDAREDRIDDWRKYKEEHNEHGTKLLKDGESDVEPDPFRLDVLTPNFAVTVKDGDDSEAEVYEGSVDPSTGEAELDENPSWEPNVSVVGLEETGEKTVEMIETGSSAQIYTSPEPGDVEDSDFLFLSADLREPNVEEKASEVLEAAGDACTVFFVEGPTENPEDFVNHVNLLFPVNVAEGDPRQFLSSAIADLFESMLRPTLQDLGKGDITAVAGERRLGKLFIDNMEDLSQLGNLTPGFEDIEAVDAMLLFVCYDGPYPVSWVDQTVYGYDRPDDAAYLWDPRTHSRYEARAHIKRIETSDISREEMAELLRQDEG